MAKNEVLHNMVEEPVLWHDRKRILGMPISFTVYDVDQDNLTIRKGLLSTTTDEMLLYRILDLKMKYSVENSLGGFNSRLEMAEESVSIKLEQ